MLFLSTPVTSNSFIPAGMESLWGFTAWRGNRARSRCLLPVTCSPEIRLRLLFSRLCYRGIQQWEMDWEKSLLKCRGVASPERVCQPSPLRQRQGEGEHVHPRVLAWAAVELAQPNNCVPRERQQSWDSSAPTLTGVICNLKCLLLGAQDFGMDRSLVRSETL